MTLQRATSIGLRIVAELKRYCARIVVAGSVRRLRPHPNDVDIVLVPRDRAAIERRIRKTCEIVKCGEDLLQAAMRDGTQLDFWFARPPQKSGDLLHPEKITPGNFGSVLLCRTGSVDHNIHLVERAKRLNLRWHPQQGVMRGSEIIASETEEEIFHALHLDYVAPNKREI